MEKFYKITFFNEILKFFINEITPLYVSVKKGNLDVVRALLKNPDIDINIPSISTHKIFLISFKNDFYF